MTDPAPAAAEVRPAAAWRWLHAGEDLLLCATLVVLVLLGISQLGVWQTLGLSINVGGLDGLARHVTLVIGMLGSMAAAREGRLLAIGTLAQALPARAKPVVTAVVGAISAAIAAGLAVAAWQFVAFERPAGLALDWGIPVWIVQLVLPAGFAVLALRLLLHAARHPAAAGGRPRSGPTPGRHPARSAPRLGSDPQRATRREWPGRWGRTRRRRENGGDSGRPCDQ